MQDQVDAPTAACLVGEVRALIYPQVLALLQRNVLRSLGADAFLVYTRKWTQWQLAPEVVATIRSRDPRRDGQQQYEHLYVRAGFDRLPSEVAREQMAGVLAALNPVAAEEASDDDVLARAADGSRGWLPVPMHRLANTSLCADADGTPNPRHVPCLFALRCMRCLQLVANAEMARGAQYTWVLRARPDVFVGCRMRVPSSAEHPIANTSDWAAYAFDYLAFMPRHMAVASLADGYRARFRRPGSVCNRTGNGLSIGCNACWVRSQYHASLLLLDERSYGQVDIARQCALKSWEGNRDAATRRTGDPTSAGFATPQGRCHPSKALSGPELTVFANSEDICKGFEAVSPFNRVAKLAWMVRSPDCAFRSGARPHSARLALEAVAQPRVGVYV